MVKIGLVVSVGEKMKIVLQIGQNLRILPNISTTTEPGFTYVSAFVDVYMLIIQVALLWQRDRATCLSVEILQLQNIPFEN